MRISRTGNSYVHIAHMFAGGLVCVRITQELWDRAPWFMEGWHRAVSYLIATVAATAVFTLPTFWLRRRFLQVDDRARKPA
jgi:hypothetical protein